MLRTHLARLLFVAGVGLAGCKAKVLDLGGLSCDAGLCAAGYTCDAATNTCVTTGNACDSATAQPSPCATGATDCAQGCRYCENNQWTECRTDNPNPTECTPSALSCDSSGNLVTCDSAGAIEGYTPCPFGCNDTATPARCNECTPSALTCLGDNLTLVTCGADGLIASQTGCQTTSRCRDAGVCVPGTGCAVQGQAPTGTPCDEGAGQNGNFCDSVCNTAGNCQATGTAPTCNDQNPCTTDSCVPASGCTNVARPVGTGCVATGTPNNPCSNSCSVSGVCQANVPVDCDDDQACTTDQCTNAGGVAVCSHGNSPSSVECRPAAGFCDQPENCTGSAPDCPTDVFASSGECRASTGTCDAAESCDGSGADCPADLPEASSTVCRASVDTVPGPTTSCDPAETCPWDGVSAPLPADFVCPADVVEPNSTVCRASTEATCDPAETCNNGACPTNTFAGAGTLCHADNCRSCNAAGLCNQMPADDPGCGTITCPADSTCRDYVADITTNRCLSAGTCKTGADCTFTSNTGTQCRAAGADACDPAENCDAGGNCPSDVVLGNGTSCGAFTCSTTFQSPACASGTCSGVNDTGCNCGSWTVTAPATATIGGVAAISVATGASCNTATANIVCTTSSVRHCLVGPKTFASTLDGFNTATRVANQNCSSNGVPTTGCAANVLAFQGATGGGVDAQTELSAAVDTTGFSSLRVNMRAAFESGTDNNEILNLHTCCLAGTGCPSQADSATVDIFPVYNGSQGGSLGTDAWCALPFANPTCTGNGFNVSFSSCANFRMGFSWTASATDEYAFVDDLTVSGVGVRTLPMTNAGSGNYTTSVQVCEDTDIVIDCRWQGSGSVLGTATINYNP